MRATTQTFPNNARVALLDDQLRLALERAQGGFVNNRQNAVDGLPEFEALRGAAREIKEHTLGHLDYYLERFEREVVAAGGHVHWASTPQEACDIVLDICREADAKTVTKGKSMVGEEIGINDALEAGGLEIVETDLGEYIIQLADEPPSHIIAPAIHKTRDQIGDLFHAHHAQKGHPERLDDAPGLVRQARSVLRKEFFRADVGITGANFLVAETGSSVIVTNEGNGDLSQTLPRVHIVTAALEKVLPTFEDVGVILRLLARSATGQEMSSYTTVSTGPRRSDDLDGPEAYHVVLVDNGRSAMLGGDFHEMLRCIRCGACLNHCPVYNSVGGHAYGWVYPGPMGSVLTPLMLGLDKAAHLPNACTLNGRCQQVCPMSIPLPEMLRKLRIKAHQAGHDSKRVQWGLKLWGCFATRPRLYRFATGIGMRILAWAGGKKKRLRMLPFAKGWTATRDFPAPAGETFIAAAKKRGLTR
ncbi:MAG: iron-sulfur cluster-binding protein [Gammaproteobacteria bacterium]|nr:iron-sulfur cluster-binding protein [Gammaproteobacteria bacterium]